MTLTQMKTKYLKEKLWLVGLMVGLIRFTLIEKNGTEIEKHIFSPFQNGCIE
jgi:hypothetical protein